MTEPAEELLANMRNIQNEEVAKSTLQLFKVQEVMANAIKHLIAELKDVNKRVAALEEAERNRRPFQ